MSRPSSSKTARELLHLPHQGLRAAVHVLEHLLHRDLTAAAQPLEHLPHQGLRAALQAEPQWSSA